MPFFSDFAIAVDTYPVDWVTLSTILNLNSDNIAPATPLAINVNERWRFKVRVTNNGQLNITNVVLHVLGQNGALVSTAAAGPFSSEIHPGLPNVNAHGSQDSVYFYFQAPSVVKPAGTVLVKAHISSCDYNLNHILIDHPDHSDPPSGTYANSVTL